MEGRDDGDDGGSKPKERGLEGVFEKRKILANDELRNSEKEVPCGGGGGDEEMPGRKWTRKASLSPSNFLYSTLIFPKNLSSCLSDPGKTGKG